MVNYIEWKYMTPKIAGHTMKKRPIRRFNISWSLKIKLNITGETGENEQVCNSVNRIVLILTSQFLQIYCVMLSNAREAKWREYIYKLFCKSKILST